MSAGELAKMHENFIVASGGKFKKQKIERTEKTKTYSVANLRETSPNAYKGWRKEEDESLVAYYKKGNNIKTISNILGRRPGAIRSRLKKLGFIKE